MRTQIPRPAKFIHLGTALNPCIFVIQRDWTCMQQMTRHPLLFIQV